LNKLTTGELWIEFLRYYTERFDYKNHIVTIRQIEPLRRDEKGWFNPTIAIEDPFILTHNLADKLNLKSRKLLFSSRELNLIFNWIEWKMIHRVFIRAREGFAIQPQGIDIQRVHINWMQVRYLSNWLLKLKNLIDYIRIICLILNFYAQKKHKNSSNQFENRRRNKIRNRHRMLVKKTMLNSRRNRQRLIKIENSNEKNQRHRNRFLLFHFT